MFQTSNLSAKEAIILPLIMVSAMLALLAMTHWRFSVFLILFLNLSGSFGLFYVGLTISKVAPQLKIATSLWALLPCAFFLSQMPYLGFILFPVELIASGLLMAFRSGLDVSKSMLIVGVARSAVYFGVLSAINM